MHAPSPPTPALTDRCCSMLCTTRTHSRAHPATSAPPRSPPPCRTAASTVARLHIYGGGVGSSPAASSGYGPDRTFSGHLLRSPTPALDELSFRRRASGAEGGGGPSPRLSPAASSASALSSPPPRELSGEGEGIIAESQEGAISARARVLLAERQALIPPGSRLSVAPSRVQSPPRAVSPPPPPASSSSPIRSRMPQVPSLEKRSAAAAGAGRAVSPPSPSVASRSRKLAAQLEAQRSSGGARATAAAQGGQESSARADSVLGRLLSAGGVAGAGAGAGASTRPASPDAERRKRVAWLAAESRRLFGELS